MRVMVATSAMALSAGLSGYSPRRPKSPRFRVLSPGRRAALGGHPHPDEEFAQESHLVFFFFLPLLDCRVRATATEMLVDEESGAELVGAASSRSVRMTCHHISLLSV